MNCDDLHQLAGFAIFYGYIAIAESTETVPPLPWPIRKYPKALFKAISGVFCTGSFVTGMISA
jgi:hypothetical protein